MYFEFSGFRILYFCISLFMWSVSLLFSKEYFAHYSHKIRYYGFMVLTLLATLGVFLSADFFTLFIFFEIMSISSYVWVAQEETEEALKASTTYLAVAIIGGMVMLMGLFLLQDAVGTLRMSELLDATKKVWNEKSGQIYTAGFCMLFGFGAKAGMFPLHFWLPKAHPVAPAPASALLSGVLTKCGVFGVLILTAEIFVHDTTWGTVIMTLGVITMVVGAVLAVFSVNLKRTLACSSVSQIGFIMIGVAMQCFLGEHNALAVRGTFLHMVNHSLIKLLLFNCAGVVFMNLHKLDLNEVRGFGRKKPFLMICFLMGALGIGGMPLWNGYVSKTLLHESIVEYIVLAEGMEQVIFKGIEYAFLISGGLTVAYMMKLFICLFIETHPTKQAEYDAKTDYMSTLSKVVIGIAAVVLPIMGLLPNVTMDKMADMVMEFMRSGHLEHQVHYFTWVNLKGALISIGIGIVVYFGIIRTVFMKNKVYVNLLPEWIDVEQFFTIIVNTVIWGIGSICKAIDIIPEKAFHCIVIGAGSLLKAIDTLPDAITDYLKKTVFAETTEPEENKLVVKLHKAMDNRVEIGRIISSSLSFGLLLVCAGLLMTILYLIVAWVF